jgi:outer membrane protein assembly factor BamD (BamD/ComL family)
MAPISKKQKSYLLILAYIFLKNNKLEKAITIYKALWHLFPETDSIAFCLSYLYLSTGQYETALFYADAYLRHKNSRLGFLLKGQSLLMLGRHFEAKEAVNHYLG